MINNSKEIKASGRVSERHLEELLTEKPEESLLIT